MNIQQNYKKTFITATSLFLLWGIITALVASLVPRLRDVFGLSYFEAGLIQFSFFIAYFFLSIPSSYLLSKVGYKHSILVGLFIIFTGCILLNFVAIYRSLYLFWFALFVLASGISLLQVVANPYITLLGNNSRTTSRLIFSQSFNSLGTMIASMFGAVYILSERVLSSEEINILSDIEKNLYLSTEAHAIQFPFMIMAFITMCIALIFKLFKFPNFTIKQKISLSNYRLLLRQKNIFYGCIALFLYVGAEVSIGSYHINYFININTVRNILDNPLMLNIVNFLADFFAIENIQLNDSKSIVGIFASFYWGGAMVGRFIGAFLTRIFAPTKVLAVFTIGAIALILISTNSEGLIAMWAILGVGFFNSVMFPTIFALCLQGVDQSLRSQASGILCTAIVGGAIIPPLFGYFADNLGFSITFLSLIFCYAILFFYVFTVPKTFYNKN